jgi:hypothetical protein
MEFLKIGYFSNHLFFQIDLFSTSINETLPTLTQDLQIFKIQTKKSIRYF